MGQVFVLMGKTYSYKKYVSDYCSTNKSFNCVSKYNLHTTGINIVLGDMDDLEDIKKNFTGAIYPVFIDTPDEVLLERGIADYSGTASTQVDMCKKFIEDSEIYSAEALERVDAVSINADNECDACYEFMKYLRVTIGVGI